MLYLAAKALLSGLIVAAASEIAKRSPAFGALILSLPLLSILAFIWLWRESADTEELPRCRNRPSGSLCRRYRWSWYCQPCSGMAWDLLRLSACLACSRLYSSPRWSGPSAGSVSRSRRRALPARTKAPDSPIAKRDALSDQAIDVDFGLRVLVPDALERRIARARHSVHGIVAAAHFDDNGAASLAA